ncbi:MAG: hypothetical protein K6E85_16275 [Lachnospiraceae bacterium]|nr:hypothetical protein [Lachnospiraceae bacterium]
MSDLHYFLIWWLAITALGLTFMPLSMMIFSKFRDKGWLFSKAIGIGISGWLVWFLSSCHIVKFNTAGIWICLILCLIGNGALLYFQIRKKKIDLTSSNVIYIIVTELVFLCVFAFWTYLKCFKPEAYGTTEKLMDFGFMEAMYKSEYMPPEDIWLAGKPINYYYVGQFMATYLSKLTDAGVEYGYNLMLMMVAAFSFSMPASIAANATTDMLKDEKRGGKWTEEILPVMTGGLAGIAVCFTSNAHYLVYAKFIPWLRTMLGLDKLAESANYNFPGYWFPNATRYIGYNPDTHDKTIHEFPLYSFVLGDLHAHVINIMFVLTVAGILFAYLQLRKERLKAVRMGLFGQRKDQFPEIAKNKDKNQNKNQNKEKNISEEKSGSAKKNKQVMSNSSFMDKTIWGIPGFFREVFSPHVLLIGFFIGLFHTTNFWDFPIYYVVSGAIILFSNAVIYNFSWITLKLTLLHAIVVYVFAKLVCLPFTISFNQISTSVNLCVDHTPLYQLAILWLLPILCVGVLLFNTIREQKLLGVFEHDASKQEDKKKAGKNIALYRFIANLNISDMFMITLGLCACGLVLLPELIYVKDIYSGDYKRANTMFKLTYQSYILFGIAMSYAIMKLICFSRTKGKRIFAWIALIVLIMTTGYFDNSTKAWFGDWTKSENYKGLNAGEYLKDVNIDDHNATNWINENIEGRPVMLEVNGNSYTDYCRVSVRTGLPTLLGWRTHEWLWQSEAEEGVPKIIEERTADIETIYTSSDVEKVRKLVKQYNIEYIYVGSIERKEFGDSSKHENPVNHELLQSLGSVVYPSGFDPADSYDTTYILKIN